MSNANQNTNGTVDQNQNAGTVDQNNQQQTQQAPPKQTFAEKHPKFAAWWSNLPGNVWAGFKKLFSGILVVGGGIALGELVLNTIAKPKKYSSQVLGGQHDLLEDTTMSQPVVDVPFVDSEPVNEPVDTTIE